MELRHHVHSPGTWLGVSDGDYRLVQSACAGLGTFHHSGYQLLFGALDRALQAAQPEIFNTDQGAQFTSKEWTSRLRRLAIRISWDGRGRALDNIFVERLWRSVKYEEVYLKEYQTISEARNGLKDYFHFYNYKRYHHSLDYQTPFSVYRHDHSMSLF